MTQATPGMRIKLVREVDRYPFFLARVGMTGTVISVTDDNIAVKMDAPLPNGEEWDNCIMWERGAENLADFSDDIEALI